MGLWPMSAEEDGRKKLSSLEVLAELQRLAGLTAVEYELEREEAANKLGIRRTKLDELVEKDRPQNTTGPGGKKKPPDWKPPETVHSEIVDGCELVAELVGAILRFVYLSASDALVAALWVLFTWVFEHCAETNPFLHVQSVSVGPTPWPPSRWR